MPVSSRHESVLNLFRERPAFVPELLAGLHVTLPPFTDARISDIALHELAPIEHFADAVVLLANENRPVLGVIVEAQLRRDDQKLYTWPQYAMNARARHKCPFLVVVTTPSRAVARWAGQPIDVGNGTVFRQHVIGPGIVPKVTATAQASREPELAVLSALTHAHSDTPAARLIASATFQGMTKLDPERWLLYSRMILNALHPAVRKDLEKMPDIRKLLTKVEQRTYDLAEATGEARGLVRGKVQGKVEGRAEGRAEGKAESVLKILTKRGLKLTTGQRRTIEDCTDLETLDRWFDLALTAGSVDELVGKTRRNGHRTARGNGHRTARRA